MNDGTPDREKLLSLIQTGFPLENRPFGIIAEQMHETEEMVISAVRSLIANRVIREFGPVFDAKKLGYVSTLAAVKIDPDRAAELAAVMLSIPEITHNYYRDGELNLWFTVTACDRDIINAIIHRVEKSAGISLVLDLPVERFFKLRAVFGAPAPAPDEPDRKTAPVTIDTDDRTVIRVLQKGLPVVAQPYLAIADELGMDETRLIERIRFWSESGVIRRLGARLDHRRAGYTVNALAAWRGANISVWGNAFAAISQVSHCYLRRSHPEWPYSLYTMIHATSDDELNETLAYMQRIAPSAGVAVMRTLYELKKTSMKYFMEE